MDYVAVLERMRSMHDLSVPLMKVWHANGPGCSPFKICHPCYSHSSINHGALELCFVSSLFRGMDMSSMVGDKFPMRVFQSPHITYVDLCGMHPTTSSIWLFITSSSKPRFYRLYTGGIYTFPTQIFSPPYTCMHTLWAYSLLMYRSILIPFLISIAIPPLVPFSLRCSKT
jgi:hypothetical protein